MKRLVILLFIPVQVIAQSFHDHENSAYVDAMKKLSHCVGSMPSVRQSLIEVSEPVQNRVTIKFPDIVISCTDPFTELHYGPIIVNDEVAVRYRIIYWRSDEISPETHIIETRQHVYSIPLPNTVNHDVFIEAYDSLGNSEFYTYDGSILVRSTSEFQP